jgi:WD40 repeat protein
MPQPAASRWTVARRDEHYDMSSSTVSATDSPINVRYPSLMALQTAHNDLLKRQRQESNTPAFHDAVLDFLRNGTATGALLDADEDRRAAQSLLDYWAARLFRLGQEPSDSTLADFDPLLAPEIPDELCPYLGLDSFREDDAAKFYGRARLVADLVDRLASQRLIAVVGPSGSGKSSLVRAGLIPALKAGALPGSQDWNYLPPIVPGSDPLASLARALRTEDQASSSDDASAILGSPLVLVVDQFEELWTLCDDAGTRQAFVAKLLELAEASDAEHQVILTMRSDFEAFVARAPELQALFEVGRIQVTPLSAAELREAIEQPAELAGLHFEAGVVALLLQDILGEPAGLPLLQFTLLKLWERRERNRVTHTAYLRAGGGRLALARSADEFYAGLIPEEQVTARRILLRMVRPGEGLELTSSRVRRADLFRGGEDPGRVERVLVKLIAVRLVRLAAGETLGDDQVEVAHEALVRNWPALVDWLEEEKAELATRRRLEGRAAEWTRLGRGTGGLLDEVQLHEAERWLSSSGAAYLGYDPVLPALVEASRAAIEVEQQGKEAARQRELELARALAATQSRIAMRLRRATIALLALLVVALAAAGLAIFQQNEAQIQKNEAQIQSDLARTAEAQAQAQRSIAQMAQSETQTLAYAGEVLFELGHRPERALLLALASRSAGNIPSQPIVSRAFYYAFGDSLIRRLLIGHTTGVRTVAWNASGHQLLTGGEDQIVRLWDAETGATIGKLEGHTGSIRAIAWSPDGQYALTAGADKTACLWNIATGQMIHTLKGHTDTVSSVAWRPDGRQVLTGSYDGTVRLWDVATGRELSVLLGQVSFVRSVTWSPDGQRILVGGDGRIARILDAATGRELHVLQGHTNIVSSVAWSPDGRSVLTASGDGMTWIWDATTGVVVRKLQGHQGWIWSAVWSPDGRQVLTGSFDGTARIWDVATGTLIRTLRGHSAKIWAVAWSPMGGHLATAGDDMTIRIWDATTGVIIHHIQEAAERVLCMALSPDRRLFLTGSDDNVARIWDVATGQLLQTLQGHTASVSAVAWGLDERYVVTGSEDTTVRIWDATTGRLLQTFQGHAAKINSLQWSRDGRRILTGSDDGTAVIWDIATGTEIEQLKGHMGGVSAAVWSSDEKLIGTASNDTTVRIWDAATAEVVHTLQGHGAKVWSVAWGPNDRQVLTGSDDSTSRIWDVLTGKEVRRLEGHTGGVLPVAWGPDGRQVLTGSDDGTVRIWDVATGTTVRILEGHTFIINYVAWNPNNRQVLTGSADGTARTWLVSNDLIIADITRRVCGFFKDDDIRTIISQWRGCNIELTAVDDDVIMYDALQDNK